MVLDCLSRNHAVGIEAAHAQATQDARNPKMKPLKTKRRKGEKEKRRKGERVKGWVKRRVSPLPLFSSAPLPFFFALWAFFGGHSISEFGLTPKSSLTKPPSPKPGFPFWLSGTSRCYTNGRRLLRVSSSRTVQHQESKSDTRPGVESMGNASVRLHFSDTSPCLCSFFATVLR